MKNQKPIFWLRLPFGKVYVVQDADKAFFAALIYMLWFIALILAKSHFFIQQSLLFLFLILCIIVVLYGIIRQYGGEGLFLVEKKRVGEDER